MSILNNFLSGLTAIAIMALILNTYIYSRNRQIINLGFIATSIGTIIYIPCNIYLYAATTSSEYINIVLVQMYGTAFYHLGLILVYSHYMKFPLRRPLFIYLAGFLFFLVARQLNPFFIYSEFSTMIDYTTIWGEPLKLPVTVSSFWGYLYILFLFSVYVTMLVMSIIQARRGNTKYVRQVLVSLAILFIAFFNDTLVFVLGLKWLFLAEAGFVAVVIVMETAIAEDVIRAYKLADELDKANKKLEERVQLTTTEFEYVSDELESFSYSVSHDLRAPLRAISGYTRILKNDYSGGMLPEVVEYLDKVQQAVGKMSLLIDGLLAFSRLGRSEVKKSTVDLNDIVLYVMKTLIYEHETRQVEWVTSELPTVEADPLMIQQVYTHILDNALKYTRSRCPAKIEIGCESVDGRLVFFVRDNGVGFNMRYVNKLFGVFQRLHGETEFEGTGIGLALVRRIIDKHGGTIWAQAEEGQGASFYFTLS